MRWMLSLAALASLALPFLSAVAPDQTRRMTVEDLWKLERVGAPSISPDGKWCVVEVTRYDLAKDEPFSELWLLATDGKIQRQLTASGGRNSGPKWSPTGEQIAFIAKRAGDEQSQVYLISPSGGEARRLTNLPFAPSQLKWSRDGKQVFFIAWTWPGTDDEGHRKKEKALKDSKVKAYIIDDAAYRYWDHWIADGKRPHVFAADVESGQHRNLLAGTGRFLPPYEPSDKDFDVSPDGKELCFVSENVKEIGLDANHDLFTVPIDAGGAQARGIAPQNLTADNPANDTNPVYSPDGKRLAFLRQKTKFFYADQFRLFVLDRSTGRAEDWLGQGKLDRSVQSPVWSGEQSFWLEVEDAGFSRLYSAVRAADGKVAVGPAFDPEDVSDRAVALDAAVRTVLFQRSSFNFPPRIMAFRQADDGGMTLRRIDRFNNDLVSQWQLGKVENISLKGADGKDLQTFIVYPPNFDPKKKWPLIQMVHGGPHNAMTNDWSYRWNPQLWASQGWVIAIVNFHGSSGFGQAFADSITGDYGSKPLTDILKTTEWFEQQPWVDKNRMAAAGASYGGYMMAYLNGHTDKFKAMVCHAGVYSYASQMASDIVVGRRRALGGFPWEDYGRNDKQSANRFAQNFRTPTLVLHGEKDYRVPITQGLEYYNTLRQKGVPARLVYFPDENHWILKGQNSLLWHKEVFAWLEKYIGIGPSE